MIDIMCLRQAYERRLITEVKWINGEANPADAMTKGKPCAALTNLIDTNRINLQAIGWVERTGPEAEVEMGMGVGSGPGKSSLDLGPIIGPRKEELDLEGN